MQQIRIPEEFDSKFRFILVAAARAKQLLNGAPSKLEPSESRGHKPHTVAIKEVAQGAIEFEVLEDDDEELVVEEPPAEEAAEEAAEESGEEE
ncbi:MAG TPA: DNA-directed RNA polymerase subunit omega [Acidobacteriota bacterium]|nr:DNA-directed RNA polymerase subunit omega [Acidobacteriota bacterium]